MGRQNKSTIHLSRELALSPPRLNGAAAVPCWCNTVVLFSQKALDLAVLAIQRLSDFAPKDDQDRTRVCMLRTNGTVARGTLATPTAPRCRPPFLHTQERPSPGYRCNPCFHNYHTFRPCGRATACFLAGRACSMAVAWSTGMEHRHAVEPTDGSGLHKCVCGKCVTVQCLITRLRCSRRACNAACGQM